MGKFQEESPPAVPGWVMSFGDMVPNLMACFVLLLSMASEQSSTLFYVGQGSFRRAIAGFGIPNLLFGKEMGPGLDYFRKLKYPTNEADEEVELQRVLDADDERIRSTFADLKRQLEAEVSGFSYRSVHCEVVADAFEQGQDALKPSAKAALDQLADNVGQNFSPHEAALYVVARCEGSGRDKGVWRLSAQRAAAAGEHLRSAMRRGGVEDWQIHAWGDGPGEQLVRQFAPQASIVVVVMKLGEP